MPLLRKSLLFFSCFSLLLCQQKSGSDGPILPGSAQKKTTSTLPFLKQCLSNAITITSSGFKPLESWRHGQPWFDGAAPDHFSQDALTLPGKAVPLMANFKLKSDLRSAYPADEWVDIYMDDCSGAMVLLGSQLTDKQGNINFKVTSANLPSIGVYAVHMRLRAHGTWTSSQLRVLPQRTQFVVFDIDGTLTTANKEFITEIVSQLFIPIFKQLYIPKDRDGAIDLTRFRAQTQNYQILYLTGRPWYLNARSRSWLQDLKFADGHIKLTTTNQEVIPNDSGVGKFKMNYLNELRSLGFSMRYAYGNATTDIHAYVNGGGVSRDRIYIVGPVGGQEGTQNLGNDFNNHLSGLKNAFSAGYPQEGVARQPYTVTPSENDGLLP